MSLGGQGDELGEGISSLRGDLETEARRYAQAQAQAHVGEANGTDASGAVQATLSAEGSVSQLQISETWRKEMRPSGLGAAVMEAISAAAIERVREWGEHVATDEVELAPGPTSGQRESLAAKVSDRLAEDQDSWGRQDAEGAAAAIVDMLDDLEAGLDQAIEQVESLAEQEITGRSGDGHVRATVTGSGQLRSVDYDERWLTEKHGFNIARSTVGAIGDAMRRVGDDPVQRAMQGTELGELQRLADDPEALVARLRGRR